MRLSQNHESVVPEPVGVAPAVRTRRTDWWRVVGPAPLLIIMAVVFSFSSPTFLTASNLGNVFRENASIYIMAAGMTLVLLISGFDLSIGSMLAFAGVMLYQFLSTGMPPVLAVLAVLLVCGAFGYFVHGLLVCKVGLNFFVVTLGTMSVLRGIVFVITNGRSEYTDSYPFVQFLGNGQIGFISVPILLAILIYAVAYVVLGYTRFGRSIYAVGGNQDAAGLAGIRVTRVGMAVYGICSLLAAVGGLMTVGRLSAASPNVGSDTSLAVAAAVLLGGTSFAGGEGGLVGTLVGTTFVIILQNGLSLLGVSAFWQSIVTGFVLIVAVAVDRARRLSER